MAQRKAHRVHPGRAIQFDILDELNLSPGALAKRLGLPRTRIERLVKGETSITPDTAVRLGRFLQGDPAFWLRQQANYDAWKTAQELADELETIEPLNDKDRPAA